MPTVVKVSGQTVLTIERGPIREIRLNDKTNTNLNHRLNFAAKDCTSLMTIYRELESIGGDDFGSEKAIAAERLSFFIEDAVPSSKMVKILELLDNLAGLKNSHQAQEFRKLICDAFNISVPDNAQKVALSSDAAVSELYMKHAASLEPMKEGLIIGDKFIQDYKLAKNLSFAFASLSGVGQSVESDSDTESDEKNNAVQIY